MKIDNVHPQLRKVINRIPSIPFHNPIALPILKYFTKIHFKPKKMLGVSVFEHMLDNARVRIYRPENGLSGAGLLWIHGGGMIIGSASNNDRECSRYAKDLQLMVFSVEYRLAPKYPFPCALNDCFEVWQWLQNAALDYGVAPDRIVISGQSAGGGLAASLAQKVLDHGGIQPAGQALFCPMLDDRTAARLELDEIKHRIWNNKNNRGAWSWYLGYPPGKADVPQYAVPARRDDLSGLPAAWIGVGDIELFYEEDCLYATRLREAGVSCQLEVVPGAPHGFEIFAPEAPITRDYMDSYFRFLREVLEL